MAVEQDGAREAACSLSPSEDEDEQQHQASSPQATGDAAASDDKPKPPKSQEAIEREERLKANADKYADYTDEELKEMVPKKEDGSPTSIGAFLHAAGTCSACSFFHFSSKGCNLGIRCRFCHDAHSKKERKRKNNRKRNRNSANKADKKGDESDSEDSDRDTKRPRPREELSRHSQLHWDAILGVALDRLGSSRPSFLKDDETLEACYGYGGYLTSRPMAFPAPGAFGFGSYPPPGAYPPPASFPPSSYPTHAWPSPGAAAFPYR